MIRLIFAMVFILIIVPSFLLSDEIYRPNPDCLKMEMPDDGGTYNNPDSVRIDTCKDSPTYNMEYARKLYVIEFDYYPFEKISMKVKDTLSWQDNSEHQQELKSAFSNLESIFGNYMIIRGESGGDLSDTSLYSNKEYMIEFEKYNLVYAVMDTINNTPRVHCPFLRTFPYIFSVNDNKENSPIFSISPNPVLDKINLKFGESSNPSAYNIEIYNQIGCLLKKYEGERNYDLEIDVSDFPKGSYFLNSGFIMKPFIIAR